MGRLVAQQETLSDLKDITNTFVYNQDFFLNVEQGVVPNWSYVRKFGRIVNCTTTLTPISSSGTYQTPTSAQSLEIISSNANDTSGGTGATKVTVIGLDSSWHEISEIVTMNGTTEVPLANQYIRVYRMYVSESGSYGNATTPSQLGTITLRNSGAGATWITLALDGSFGLGQSLCGAYTVPSGYTAYVYAGYLSTESSKAITGYFFQRSNTNDVTAPYSGTIRVTTSVECTGGFSDFGDRHLLGVFDERTDMGWMAKSAAGTATVSVEFKIYLKKKK